MPPAAGLESLLGKPEEKPEEESEEKNDIADDEGKDGDEDEDEEMSAPRNPMFPFLFPGMPPPGQDNTEASKNLQELLQRQAMIPGMMNPLAGLATGAPNQQFQGLFNMFLSEMLKKVQKDTPPQTPPSSPPPHEESCAEETSS